MAGWGEGWLERVAQSPTWDLAAIVDRDPGAVAAAKARWGLRDDQCFDSVAAAAQATEADAALIVVPVTAHLPVASEAFDNGLNVLIEKPIADTMPHSIELVRRADEAGVTLMVSQNYRFRRAAQVVSRIVADGWLGEIGHVNINVRKEMHFVLPDQPFGFGAYEVVRDFSIHHLDQMRRLLHLEPNRVYAAQTNPPWSWFAHPPMVNALIELENGAQVHYFGSWGARGRQTTWDGDWYIECERGQIDFSNNTVLVHPTEPWHTIQRDGFIERNGWLEAEIPFDRLEDHTSWKNLVGVSARVKSRLPAAATTWRALHLHSR